MPLSKKASRPLARQRHSRTAADPEVGCAAGWLGFPRGSPNARSCLENRERSFHLSQNENHHFTLCLQGCGLFHARKIREPPSHIQLATCSRHWAPREVGDGYLGRWAQGTSRGGHRVPREVILIHIRPMYALVATKAKRPKFPPTALHTHNEHQTTLRRGACAAAREASRPRGTAARSSAQEPPGRIQQQA